MQPEAIHITESELIQDPRGVLDRIQGGTDIIIERAAEPIAVLRPTSPVHRTISDCIELAKAHEKESGSAPTLEPDFAADVQEIIRNRKPRSPVPWE